MAPRGGLLVPKEYAGPKKCIIGFAQGGHPEPEFYESLLQFLLHDGSPQGRHVFAGIVSARSPYIENNRNICVQNFRATPTDPTDALLFIDTDHRYTPDQIYGLLDSLDEEHPVVGGLYFNYWEDGNIYPVWLEHAEDGTLRNCTKVAPNQMQEVAAVGSGFMAIQRRVLDAMAEAHGGDNWTWFGRDVVQGVHVGDDTTFCLRAAALGFKVWGNTNVIVDHCKKRWLGWQDFSKHWTSLDTSTSNAANGSELQWKR